MSRSVLIREGERSRDCEKSDWALSRIQAGVKGESGVSSHGRITDTSVQFRFPRLPLSARGHEDAGEQEEPFLLRTKAQPSGKPNRDAALPIRD
jgi:hypothetical protein